MTTQNAPCSFDDKRPALNVYGRIAAFLCPPKHHPLTRLAGWCLLWSFAIVCTAGVFIVTASPFPEWISSPLRYVAGVLLVSAGLALVARFVVWVAGR